jgi:type VI secretion system VasD/TssJ family lipoprotein
VNFIQSGFQMRGAKGTMGKVILALIIWSVLISGCGIFGGGGGPKERTLEISFRASDKLNYDGTAPNVVQVAVFVLTDTERFLGGRVETFFDADFDRAYYSEFAADTLGAWVFTVKPGETDTQILRYMPGPAQSGETYLGIIGDFFNPPGDGRERAIFTLRNKSVDRLTVVIGENLIESITR